jgi:hypothetical protein
MSFRNLGRVIGSPSAVTSVARAWVLFALMAMAPALTAAVEQSAALEARVGSAGYVSEERRADGSLFNRESGRLQRMALELRYPWAEWQWVGELSRASGVLDYAGQTQFGIPLYTRTDLQREDAALSLRHTASPGLANVRLSVGAGVSALRIVRDIRPTPISSELTETLRSRQFVLSAGAGTTLVLIDQAMDLSAFALWRRPWAQTLAVDAHGLFEPLTLRPRAAWSSQAGLSASVAAGRAVRLGVGFGMDVFRPGASGSALVYRNGVPVGSASYPGSRQRLTHTDIALDLRF